VSEKEANEKKLKALESKSDATQNEKTAAAVAQADTKKDKDVTEADATLLKTKNKK